MSDEGELKMTEGLIGQYKNKAISKLAVKENEKGSDLLISPRLP